MSDQFKSAGKELLRVMLLAAIPVTIDGLITGELSERAIAITAVVAGLRFVDKYLHEKGKNEGNESLEKGLTRF